MSINAASEIFQGAFEEALAGLKGARNLHYDIFNHGKKADGYNDENLRNQIKRLNELGFTNSKKKAQIRQREVKFFLSSFSTKTA